MKLIPTVFFLLFSCTCFAQKGDELLVYSLKGNVSVVENNTETPVKVGKVLKPGSTIKTRRASKLTMVCRQGKPISVTREGVFPVVKWKDSCETEHLSATTKYFQFIWDQLYVRSDEYKREHPQSEQVLTDAPVRGQENLEIITSAWLDTIYFATGDFPLSWTTTKPYSGKYYFSLLNTKTNKTVYRDSVSDASFSLAKLKRYMRTGNVYKWKVSLQKDQKEGEEGFIKYISASQRATQVNKLKAMVSVHEEPAAQYFRLAYLLRELKYAADAYQYFRKAAAAMPGFTFYNEKLDEFRKDYFLQ